LVASIALTLPSPPCLSLPKQGWGQGEGGRLGVLGRQKIATFSLDPFPLICKAAALQGEGSVGRS